MRTIEILEKILFKYHLRAEEADALGDAIAVLRREEEWN